MMKFLNISNQQISKLIVLSDQCVVSGSNFLVSILLTRFLGVDNYGIFAFYWMLVLFASGIHQSLIIMPIYTLYAKKQVLADYISATFWIQLFFSVAVSLIIFIGLTIASLFISGLYWENNLLISIIVGVYLLQDYIRRVLFVLKRPKQSLLLDIISNGTLPLIFYALWHWNLLDLTSAFLGILGALTLSSCVGLMLLNIHRMSPVHLRSICSEHWSFSKYLFLSSLLQWFSGNIFIVFAGIIIGPAAIGAIRIAQNLLGILNVFFLFLENVIPLKAAELLNRKGEKALRPYFRSTTKRYFIPFLAILALILIFQDVLIDQLYGLSSEVYHWLIPAFCLLYVFIFFGTMLRFFLRTVERNKVIFLGYITTTLLSVIIAFPMIYYLEIVGVMFGLIIAQIISLHVYIHHLNRSL